MPPTNSSPSLHHETTVVRSAIQPRLLVLTLIFLWRTLLSPYVTSASINPNCLSTDPSQQNVLFPSLSSAIESSIVWDSVYFVRIAERRYEYEQTYAFFPLLPLCMSMLSRTVLAPLVPVIGQRAVLGLSGYVINNIGFVFAAVYLYRGVGFLRYFHVKQLQNFLLASPILSLALFSIVHYAKSKPETFFSLGFRAPPEDQGSSAVLFSLAEYSSRSQGSTFKQALVYDLPWHIVNLLLSFAY